MESWGIGIMADFAKAAFPAFAAASAELAGYDGRKKILVRSITSLCHHAIDPLSPTHSDDMCDPLRLLMRRQDF